MRRFVRSREAREPLAAVSERYDRAIDLVAANEAKGSAFWKALDAAVSSDADFAAWLGDATVFEDVPSLTSTSGRPVVLDVLRDGSPVYRRSTFQGKRVALRSLRFSGTVIARASSREDSDDRAWLEVTIYAVDGQRSGSRRWVIHRAGQTDRGLAHSLFAVVGNGAEALKFLADEQTGWVAASALDALDEASEHDEDFRASMGDLLEGTNFRAVTGRDRVTHTRDRRVLEALAGGAVLVALGDGPRKVVWQARASNVDRPTPAQFLQLSRRGFIRKQAAGDGFSEWTISDRGRSALAAAAGEA